jgi:peroxiredoxin Q/BCP
MVQLRHDYQGFVERGAEIIAIGPEEREQFKQFWREHELPFVGLADPRHSVARLYRQEVNLLKLGRMPAQLIVDKQGRIRYQYYGRSMADISPNDRLFSVLDALNREAAAE